MFNEKVNLNETRRRRLEQKEKFASQSVRRWGRGGGRESERRKEKNIIQRAANEIARKN